MLRPLVSDDYVSAVVLETLTRTRERIVQHGPGAYASNHECYGIVAEEVYEALQALHKNDRAAFREELKDIAVACLFGMASIDAHSRIKQAREVA